MLRIWRTSGTELVAFTAEDVAEMAGGSVSRRRRLRAHLGLGLGFRVLGFGLEGSGFRV